MRLSSHDDPGIDCFPELYPPDKTGYVHCVGRTRPIQRYRSDLCIRALPVTKAIPFAILTSRDRDNEALADLPQSAALLKRGAKLGDDLADALAQFGIT